MLPTVYLASDLHLPNGPFEWPQAALDADIVLVAGDLGTGDAFYFDFLKQLAKPVVFVPGNHDFWTNDPNRTVADILADMRAAVAGSQVQILYNEYCDILGVRIIGSTLWANFGGQNDCLMEVARRTMRDFRYINAHPRQENPEAPSEGFSPEIALQWHNEALAFIKTTLAESPLPAIVLTHMAPSYQSLTGVVRPELLNPTSWASRGADRHELTRVAYYASALESLIKQYRPLLWAHGHVHRRADYPIGNTRVLANPRGYYEGPLTQADVNRFRLFGYSISPAMLAESQARFAAYPYWGDSFGFEPELSIALQEGVSPIFEQALQTVHQQLAELHTECLALCPLVSHPDPVIRNSVQESFERRSEQFDQEVERFLEPMVSAWASEHYHAHLTDVRTRLAILGFPDMPGASTSFSYSPATENRLAKESLKRMAALMKVLPKVCRAPAHARSLLARAVRQMKKVARADGIRLTAKGPLDDKHWRELPLYGMGRIYLSGSAEAIDHLTTKLDQLVNPRRGRRQHSFHFCAEAEAAEWGDTL